MNIEKYYAQLNGECQAILQRTLKLRNELGKIHHLAANIHDFAENITDSSEKDILFIVSHQIETSTLNVTLGMYRQAFSSLRLAFEMGLAAVHFSAHKLDLNDWLNGHKDIKWSTLIDENDGVFSHRFTRAFFSEFSADAPSYRSRSIELYRSLSEFVHGNSETWKDCGIRLDYSEETLKKYFESANTVAEIVLFVISCRYLKTFSLGILEGLDFIKDELGHLDYLRIYLGGAGKPS